jgi:hypothetical protein
VPLGPGVVLSSQPVERLPAQLGPTTLVELGGVLTDATASQSGGAGSVGSVTGLQVVGQERLSRKGRGIQARGRGREMLVLQTPLGQRPLSGSLVRPLLAGEDGGEPSLDNEQRVAEIVLPQQRPALRVLDDGQLQRRLDSRPGFGEPPQIEQ